MPKTKQREILNRPLGFTLWYGWYSPTAEQMGCPVWLYLDTKGNEVRVTAVTFESTGESYKSDCKRPLGILRAYLGVDKSGYRVEQRPSECTIPTAN